MRLVIAILFILPTIVNAQIQEDEISKLAEEREIILQKIDSLERRLEEVDAQMKNVDPADRLEAMISKYGKNKGKMIAEGKVWTSISYEMAVDSWGEPEKVQKTMIATGSTEKWLYPDGAYLFFKNGRLQSWKKEKPP